MGDIMTELGALRVEALIRHCLRQKGPANLFTPIAALMSIPGISGLPIVTAAPLSDAAVIDTRIVLKIAIQLKRARADVFCQLTVAPPETTIFPSGCTAMADTPSDSPPKTEVILPAVPKLVSTAPQLL